LQGTLAAKRLSVAAAPEIVEMDVAAFETKGLFGKIAITCSSHMEFPL
jgi:hypothetical protein